MPEESLRNWAHTLPERLEQTTLTACQVLELASEIASGSTTLEEAARQAEGLQVLAAVDSGLRLARTASDCESFLDATGDLHDAELLKLEYLGAPGALGVPDLVDQPAWRVCILRFGQAGRERRPERWRFWASGWVGWRFDLTTGSRRRNWPRVDSTGTRAFWWPTGSPGGGCDETDGDTTRSFLPTHFSPWMDICRTSARLACSGPCRERGDTGRAEDEPERT